MEKEFKITYSASNEKSISVGEFEITVYQPLESVIEDAVGLTIERIELKDLTSISIDIKALAKKEEKASTPKTSI